MKCRNIRKKLHDYIDGILSPKDIELVEEHISKCDSCQHEMEILNNLSGFIHKVDYPPVSIWENFLSDLHRRIDRESVISFVEEQKRRIYVSIGWAVAATSAVIFLMASILIEYKLDNIRVHQNSNINVSSKTDDEKYLSAEIVSKNTSGDKRGTDLKNLQNINEAIYIQPNYNYYSNIYESQNQSNLDNESELKASPLYEDPLEDYYIDNKDYYVSSSGSI
jgi:hypothetical protein